MDPQEVRILANRLRAQADALTAVANQVDGIVRNIGQSWHGPVATDFIGWWQNTHRPALLKAKDAVAGLAQSADNNASQQDGASNGAGTSSSGSMIGTVVTTAAMVGASASVAAVKNDAGKLADSAVSSGAPGTFGTAVVKSAESQLNNGPLPAYLEAAPGATSGEWCAAFVTWNLKQNGFAPTIRDPAYVGSWIEAARAGQDHLSITTHPQPGDLVAYQSPSGEPLHMGIVTAAPDQQGRFSVISGNFDNKVAPANGATSIYGRTQGGTETWRGETIRLGAPIFIHVAH